MVIFLGIFLFIDFRPRRDRLHSLFLDEKYEKILLLVSSEKNLSEEELSIASISISRLEKKINERATHLTKETIQKKCKCKVSEISDGSKKKFSLSDRYFSAISPNGYFSTKTLIEKILTKSKGSDSLELFLKLLEKDPRNLSKEFSISVLEYLKWNSIQALTSVKKEKVLDLIHFLANNEETDFKNRLFLTKGENVNIRSGPGVENSTVAKVQGNEFLFVIDRDFKNSEIAGKTGVWLEVYIFSSGVRGWVFSAFTEQAQVDQHRISNFTSQLPKTQKGSVWDFNEWDGSVIPENFFGEYVKSSPVTLEGNMGLVVWQGKDLIEKQICRKTDISANQIEFRFKHLSGSKRVYLMTIKIIHGTKTFPAFRIDSDPDGIFVNNNKVLLEREASIHKVVIAILQKKENSFLAKLESGDVVLNFKSLELPMEGIDGRRLFFEICVPQIYKKEKSSAAIFGFHFKDEEINTH